MRHVPEMPGVPDSPAPLGSARIQHGARKRRDITGINRVNRTWERVANLVSLAATGLSRLGLRGMG